MRIKKYPLGWLVLFFGWLSLPAWAVGPPNFIFNLAAQVAQAFSLMILFLSTLAMMAYKHIKTWWETVKPGKVGGMALILGVLVFSLLLAYVYALQKQKVAYRYFKPIKGHSAGETKSNPLPVTGEHRGADAPYLSGKPVLEPDPLDKLSWGALSRDIEPPTGKLKANFAPEDNASRLALRYYRLLLEGAYPRAARMRGNRISPRQLQAQYQGATAFRLDKIIKIDSRRSSFELLVFKGGKAARYGVLLTCSSPPHPEILKLDSLNLDTGEITAGTILFFNGKPYQNDSVLKNSELASWLERKIPPGLLLDVREDYEYRQGAIPGSRHIRFADLKAGRWLELPRDMAVCVIHATGVQGQAVSAFLRKKRLPACSLEDGIRGWLSFNGSWQGSRQFGDPRYQLLLDTDQVKQKLQQGAILIDCRAPSHRKFFSIPAAFWIAPGYMTGDMLASVLRKVPKGARVITCGDDFFSNQDSLLVGIELEKLGVIYLGRYDKPWEYRGNPAPRREAGKS